MLRIYQRLIIYANCTGFSRGGGKQLSYKALEKTAGCLLYQCAQYRTLDQIECGNFRSRSRIRTVNRWNEQLADQKVISGLNE